MDFVVRVAAAVAVLAQVQQLTEGMVVTAEIQLEAGEVVEAVGLLDITLETAATAVVAK